MTAVGVIAVVVCPYSLISRCIESKTLKQRAKEKFEHAAKTIGEWMTFCHFGCLRKPGSLRPLIMSYLGLAASGRNIT